MTQEVVANIRRMTQNNNLREQTPEMTTVSGLCEIWECTVRHQVKPSTFACYTTLIQKHIRPSIGSVPVRELDNQILLKFILERQEQGLAASTLRLILFLLKSAVRCGEKRRIFTAEPLDFFLPKDRGNGMRLLNRENRRKLLNRLSCCRTPFETGLFLSSCTGIRVGELCGLRWGDIDLEEGILHIRRTVSRIRNTQAEGAGVERNGIQQNGIQQNGAQRNRIQQNGTQQNEIQQNGAEQNRINQNGTQQSGTEQSSTKRHDTEQPGTEQPSTEHVSKTFLYIGSPKTETSQRDIPLPEFVLERLREKKGEECCYFLTGRLTCMEPRGVQRRFKNLLRKMGIPEVNIHSLRHSFASQWIENGFDSKTLSEVLGHASVKITMDIYVHSSMDRKRACMEKLSFD